MVTGKAGAGVAFAAGRFLRDIGLMGVGIADLCDVFASTFAAEARARAKDTSVTCRAIAIFLAALLARDGGGASPKADPQGHQAPERQVSLRFCVHGVFLDRCSCSNFVCTLVLSQAQQVRSERFGGGGLCGLARQRVFVYLGFVGRRHGCGGEYLEVGCSLQEAGIVLVEEKISDIVRVKRDARRSPKDGGGERSVAKDAITVAGGECACSRVDRE